MARYAYFRVSTENQSHERQLYRMTEYFTRMGMGWDDVEIVSEKITSHTQFTQRAIYPVLKNAKEGDIIFVCQLDRLGRTMVDILELVDFAVKRGVVLLTIDNGYQLENKTAMGKLYLGMVSAMAEAERELRAERCQAGTDAAMEELRTKGRRVTRRGTVQTHWGNAGGTEKTKEIMRKAREASAVAAQDRAIRWREGSKAVRFALRKRAEGWGVTQIAEELGKLYDDSPEVYGTPTGSRPSKGHVSKWIREANPLTLAV